MQIIQIELLLGGILAKKRETRKSALPPRRLIGKFIFCSEESRGIWKAEESSLRSRFFSVGFFMSFRSHARRSHEDIACSTGFNNLSMTTIRNDFKLWNVAFVISV